jgi:hypothetical protein
VPFQELLGFETNKAIKRIKNIIIDISISNDAGLQSGLGAPPGIKLVAAPPLPPKSTKCSQIEIILVGAKVDNVMLVRACSLVAVTLLIVSAKDTKNN